MDTTHPRREGVSSVFEDSGGQHPLSLLISNLIKRIEDNGDEEAVERLAAFLTDRNNAERYVAYCSLQEMRSRGVGFESAIAAFEQNPGNKRLLEIWRECGQ